MIRKFAVYILLALTIFIFSFCEEKVFTWDVDCNECYVPEPDSVDLIIHWSKDAYFEEIPVVLFQGKVDDGVFIDTFYCFEDPAYIYVKANEEYAVKAIYDSEDKTVVVVDGTEQKNKKVSEACSDPCWVVLDVDLYVKLKF